MPGPGEWKLSVWRTDAAGNHSEAHRSVPVTLRYDPEPPKLAFESPDSADPTLVAARATDELSGVACGVIDIAPMPKQYASPYLRHNGLVQIALKKVLYTDLSTEDVDEQFYPHPILYFPFFDAPRVH